MALRLGLGYELIAEQVVPDAAPHVCGGLLLVQILVRVHVVDLGFWVSVGGLGFGTAVIATVRCEVAAFPTFRLRRLVVHGLLWFLVATLPSAGPGWLLCLLGLLLLLEGELRGEERIQDGARDLSLIFVLVLAQVAVLVVD